MRHTFYKLNIRLAAMVLVAVVLLSCLPAAAAAETSGMCGDNLSWSFADGRLTITGSGKMTDYNQVDMPPWYEYRDQIFQLSLPAGMTTVGRMAFYDCYNLTAVTIPSSVTAIGNLAFCQCRGMLLLNLGSGLQIIGESAFELCENLMDLRLPASLTAIGSDAFYRCASVQYVEVPALVTELGTGVFAHCTSLITARIEAQMAVLPSQTFYGCDSLTTVVLPGSMKSTESNAFGRCDGLHTVYYPGTEADAVGLRESIGQDQQNFAQFGSIENEVPDNTGTSTDVIVTDDGTIVIDQTTVISTDNATVSTTVTNTADESGVSASVEMNATIVTDSGWEEVSVAVDEAIKILQDKCAEGAAVDSVQINGYVTGNGEVPQEILDKISGADISLDVLAESGARFEIDGDAIRDQEISGSLILSYTISQMASDTYTALEGAANYSLRFDSSSAVNTEVMIRLPIEYARRTASLYQLDNNEPVLLQSVVIDGDSYAHFYIAEINKDTQYLIGIDVPGISQESLIIPEELYGEYGITDLSSPIEYVITGRTSSWGMNGLQVGLILGGVMLVCVVGIGAFMYARNKRRLRMGYIPEFEDDEEDDEE